MHVNKNVKNCFIAAAAVTGVAGGLYALDKTCEILTEKALSPAYDALRSTEIPGFPKPHNSI